MSGSKYSGEMKRIVLLRMTHAAGHHRYLFDFLSSGFDQANNNNNMMSISYHLTFVNSNSVCFLSFFAVPTEVVVEMFVNTLGTLDAAKMVSISFYIMLK